MGSEIDSVARNRDAWQAAMMDAEKVIQEQHRVIVDLTAQLVAIRRVGVFDDQSLLACLTNSFHMAFPNWRRTDPQDMIQLMAAEIISYRGE